ncbi:hypothetical protein PFICI_05435 [Pestalotiopsis fici W106-1]|uniref:Kinesin motor domain-containing protein n=1 Tax=Pestalotiopsis fici (strain W106-1 / CGMCC3.15140) TaxID=1229662 RepID=W3XC09_PESFW|nr:uncharacterized protein PFICI_05435 [Pestalotiopsis fici W106-1]ETS83559.1 hypothetical protein PFICI_05435 [Pestalotiopsis fici W106-1]
MSDSDNRRYSHIIGDFDPVPSDLTSLTGPESIDFDRIPVDLTTLTGPENMFSPRSHGDFDSPQISPRTIQHAEGYEVQEDSEFATIHAKLDAMQDIMEKQHQEFMAKLSAPSVYHHDAHDNDSSTQSTTDWTADSDQELQDTIERKADQSAAEIVKSLRERITQREAFDDSSKQLEAAWGDLQTARNRIEMQKKELTSLRETLEERDENISQSREGYEKLEAEFRKLRDHLEQERAANRRQFEKLQDYQGKIRVIARIRPMMRGDSPDDEQDFGERLPGEFSANWGQFRISEEQASATGTRTVVREQSLERIFGPEATNGDVFEELEFLVSSGLSGSQCAIFAYGPSGTGKTHTLSAISGGDTPDDVNDGVLPQTLAMAFRHAQEDRHRWEFTFGLSATEVYLDEARDMVSNQPAKVALGRDVQQPSVQIRSYEEAMKLLARVLAKRRVGSTAVHDKSSRSHMIFSLRIHRRTVDGSSKSVEGCVHICDLAGSEKIADTASPVQKKEGVDINSSLTDLITTLQQLGGGHRPTPNHSLGKPAQERLPAPDPADAGTGAKGPQVARSQDQHSATPQAGGRRRDYYEYPRHKAANEPGSVIPSYSHYVELHFFLEY